MDREGRIWVVDDVDVSKWSDRVDDANSALAEVGERGSPLGDPAQTIVSEASGYEPGDVITRTPLSWTTGCTNSDSNDHVWDYDSRNEVTTPTQRQKATVLITSDDGAVATCSGVLLNDLTVLTAAHCFTYCVTGGQDTQTWTTADACSWGNAYSGSTCRESSSVIISSAYDEEPCGHGDPGDDWAIVNLATAMPSSTTEFDLSQLTGLGSRQIQSLGFPVYHPGSGTCTLNSPTGTDTNHEAATLSYQNGVIVTDFTGAVAKTKMDAMSRQSGSPVYYCSGSDDYCDNGEKGMVAMVLADWSPNFLGDRFEGPRIVNVRDDIIAVIENP